MLGPSSIVDLVPSLYNLLNGKIPTSKVWANKRLEDLVMEDVQYLVKNVFHGHKKYPDFLGTSTTIPDCSKTELQLGLIEYRFKKEEHHISPHKNPCRSGKAFTPTAPSTLEAIKRKDRSHKGSLSIFDESVEEAGGVIYCEVGADMPRDVKQISNARQILKEKEEHDEFASLLGLARQDPAIRNLQSIPNPRVVFATDQQLSK